MSHGLLERPDKRSGKRSANIRQKQGAGLVLSVSRVVSHGSHGSSGVDEGSSEHDEEIRTVVFV